MLRSLAAALTLAAILGAGPAVAQSESRVALVIGNGAYQHLPRLANPVNDAELMAMTLKSVGFQLIGGSAQTDLDRSGFERAIRQFGAELAGGAVGLFYYAGHGLQVQGANFLVPVPADPISVADIDFELIDANIVLKQMEAAGSKLNIIILDACRNNPFGGRGLRDASAGLAPMRAPHGTLISYATQPGNTALDGTAGHSPYTAALAETIKRPGLQIFEVFNDVALSVDKTTGGRQQPWIAISPLSGSFYFLESRTPSSAPAAAPPWPEAKTASASPSPDAETVFWQSIGQSTNIADFQEYLRLYPNGRFAGLARNRLASVRPQLPPSGPESAAALHEPKSLPPAQTPSSNSGRYQVQSCGSIRDSKTNLLWFIGPDTELTWNQATKWVEQLQACNKNWRMPALGELKTLFDPSQTAGIGFFTDGRYFPAHIDPVFARIGKDSWVWTTGNVDARGAPAINFYLGIGVRLRSLSEGTVRAFAVANY